jgi:hypothetical protein
MKLKHAAVAVLAALVVGVGALIAIEFANGATDYGTLEREDPCTAQDDFSGSGLDATLQRIALSGLNGAACELGVTREELVLSFAPNVAPKEIKWDQATIERAVRKGMLKAVDDAEERGSLPGIAALILREVIQRAPIDWLIKGAGELADLFG